MTRAWSWVVAAVLLCVAGAAAADDKPSGTVTIESTSVALGIGVSWGDGKLNYRGKTHAVKGLSVVDVGVSKVSARGKVYHLAKLGDFPGNFTAVQAGATVGGGASVVALRNQNGVVLELTSSQTGVKFTLAGEGIEVKLK